MSRFKGQTVFVAGVEHPLGASLTRRLVGFGANVVALGEEEEALWRLAQRCNGSVETLGLGRGWRDVLRILQDCWADEPVHLFVDLFPMAEATSMAETRDVFSRSAALAAALVHGMRAGEARAVLCFPAAQGGTPNRGTRAASYAGMVGHFGKECAPGRFHGLKIEDAGNNWSDAALVSAGDAVLMLCHPISRGVKSGTVLNWAP
ncbi:hypothetical protein [Pacificoceanicola onchidii]|uniref:hypothetical protein n=1 Tax=Pacificoceanicola onchidii TaxID=2562685 RepID=UPI0010A53F9C|nr:hypothetical protein [Pacificoceanicola onchidii]